MPPERNLPADHSQQLFFVSLQMMRNLYQVTQNNPLSQIIKEKISGESIHQSQPGIQ